MEGVLYLCATPIGNLEDITRRSLRILQEADLIAAEDTRHTRHLLSFYGIKRPLTSYHRHSREKKTDELIQLLQAGKSIALVTDAGSPGVSDPGEELVRRAVEAGIRVVAVPGPSALIAALTVSGFDTRRFVFEGFLPRSRGERIRRLEELAGEPRTIVCFEAPHRLLDTLEAMLQIWGERRVVVARELTKKFEDLVRGGLEQVLEHFRQHLPKGEITLVVEGQPRKLRGEVSSDPNDQMEALAEVAEMVRQGLTPREAIKRTAVSRGLVKRELYRAWNNCRIMGDGATTKNTL